MPFYGYRYYNPELGRWLNRDPIGERGGPNLYAMAANDSVNAGDYLGLFGNTVLGTEYWERVYQRYSLFFGTELTCVCASGCDDDQCADAEEENCAWERTGHYFRTEWLYTVTWSETRERYIPLWLDVIKSGVDFIFQPIRMPIDHSARARTRVIDRGYEREFNLNYQGQQNTIRKCKCENSGATAVIERLVGRIDVDTDWHLKSYEPCNIVRAGGN